MFLKAAAVKHFWRRCPEFSNDREITTVTSLCVPSYRASATRPPGILSHFISPGSHLFGFSPMSPPQEFISDFPRYMSVSPVFSHSDAWHLSSFLFLDSLVYLPIPVISRYSNRNTEAPITFTAYTNKLFLSGYFIDFKGREIVCLLAPFKSAHSNWEWARPKARN